MKAGGRVEAAIEVLGEIGMRHRPASEALADWGRAHRFAGSGDRAAIGNLVFDALRRKSSIACVMGDDSPRAAALGALHLVWGFSVDDVAALADGGPHAPSSLTDQERAALLRELPGDASAHVRGDFPAWLAPQFEAAFGSRAAEEGAALAQRAPVDLRVNTLKADRAKVARALSRLDPVETKLSPVGLRIAHARGPGKPPHVEAEPAHGKGWFEVQDEGSQIAAIMTGAAPGMQILDLCAGAGGKTLAMAASMENKGQIYAYDSDRHRLRPIFERLKRAGVRNAQVIAAGDGLALDAMHERMDIVLIDAPCTGSGTWRRKPDAKWRLTQAQMEMRITEQAALFDRGAEFVKAGGLLVYVTCSVLPAENIDQVRSFLDRTEGFSIVPSAKQWRELFDSEPPSSAIGGDDFLQLTPASHGTDGFFVAVLRRR